MAKKRQLPSDESINKKKDDFKNLVQDLADGKIIIRSNRETAKS